MRIRGLKVLIEGNAIDFKSGGPGEGHNACAQWPNPQRRS